MRSVIQELTETRRAQYIMGTIVEIVARTTPTDCDVQPIDKAMLEFERLERMFNRFDPDSELSEVNRSAAQKPVRVSAELFDILSQAGDFGRRSDGSFSHTLGPLTRLWTCCADADRLPRDAEIRRAREQSDFRLVELDSRRRTVTFAREGVEVDLGGLVKGYAVDRARSVLIEEGVEDAFISAGTSSIAAIGSESASRPWTVAIRNPLNEGGVLGTLRLKHECISTSGTNERSASLAGRIVSHLIHPQTGLPVEGQASATALCHSAMHAEVVSKMLMFLGCERALEICDENDWPADGFVVTAQGSGDGAQVEYTGSLNISLF